MTTMDGRVTVTFTAAELNALLSALGYVNAGEEWFEVVDRHAAAALDRAERKLRTARKPQPSVR